VDKYDRAKEYCEKPFDSYPEKPKRDVFIPGERIGARLVSAFPQDHEPRSAYLRAVSADRLALPADSLDAVLTDPPYFGNVQYAELMDFCYVWLRRHLLREFSAFRPSSTRSDEELTVNETEGRGIVDFTAGLSRIFVHFTRALKPGRPFAFTYHHNDIEAYLPIAVALLDARLVCTDTLPCPAEMGASIHISGTGSSVMDTVFICRTTGKVRAGKFATNREALKRRLRSDLEKLQRAGLTPKAADALCLLFGHMVRLTVWQLRPTWRDNIPVADRLDRVRDGMQEAHPLDLLHRLAMETFSSLSDEDLLAHMRVREGQFIYDGDEVSF
jgi:hypothetical protein